MERKRFQLQDMIETANLCSFFKSFFIVKMFETSSLVDAVSTAKHVNENWLNEIIKSGDDLEMKNILPQHVMWMWMWK